MDYYTFFAEEILKYVHELAKASQDPFDYFIKNFQSLEHNVNGAQEIEIGFNILPTTPVFGYTLTFQTIRAYEESFINNIFLLLQHLTKDLPYRPRHVGLKIDIFRLTITFSLV